MNRLVVKVAVGLLVGLLFATAVFHLRTNPSASAATASQPSAAFVEQPCPMALARDEIDGATVICGIVSVPEDYADPSGKQIDLAVAILKAHSLSPAADPVIYLHGGPGAAELHSLASLSERLDSLRLTRDVIVFDQRGTGLSNQPLACDVEYATGQEEAREAFREIVGEGRMDEDTAVNRAMFTVCLARFADNDTDLAQYNTPNNARDVLSIAAALGYDTINLYGFSYGTQVALEVMRERDAPLRSVILDSVAPADLKLYENFGLPNVEAITSLFDLCKADGDCRAAYPDLESRFVALLDALAQQPLAGPDGKDITAASLVATLRQSDIRPGLGAYIPRMIWELEQGQTATYAAINSNTLPPPVPTDADPVALRYAETALSPDAQLFVDSGLELRATARQTAATADRFLTRADAQIALDQAGSTTAARFDLLFHEILTARPLDQRLSLNQAYLSLPLQSNDVATLRAFVTQNLQGVDAQHMLQLVDQMDDEDVAALWAIIFGKARDYATFFNVALVLNLLVCQEHVPHNTIDGALETFGELSIPQVAGGKLRTVQTLLGNCDLFPTGRSDSTFHEPVSSDLPTLIMLGTADSQTATSWGEHAAASLPNSQIVQFPESGHGVTRYSQCARDIAAAFFNQPQGQLDSSCTEDLAPLFVLPSE